MITTPKDFEIWQKENPPLPTMSEDDRWASDCCTPTWLRPVSHGLRKTIPQIQIFFEVTPSHE